MEILFTANGPLDGVENMARDVEALAEAERGVASARLYEWDGVWITLGRFQDPKKALLQSDVPWIRRPTGGRAVLHGHDLTVSLALPFPATSSRSIDAAYNYVVTPLLQALESCGLPIRLGGSDQEAKTPFSSDCFASTSRYDLSRTDTNQKFCGCALRVGVQAILLQASLPIRRPSISPTLLIAQASPAIVDPWNHAVFKQAFEEATTHMRSPLPSVSDR